MPQKAPVWHSPCRSYTATQRRKRRWVVRCGVEYVGAGRDLDECMAVIEEHKLTEQSEPPCESTSEGGREVSGALHRGQSSRTETAFSPAAEPGVATGLEGAGRLGRADEVPDADRSAAFVSSGPATVSSGR